LTRCIKGTQLGPIEKCIKSTFVFTSGVNFDLMKKNENIEIGSLIANIDTA